MKTVCDVQTGLLNTATAAMSDHQTASFVPPGRDATQEAFARALAAREQFRGEGSFEGWVWRIAIRVRRF